MRGQAGFGLVEILVVLVVVAVAGAVLYGYLVSTTKTVETIQQQKPLSSARLAADRATVVSIRTSLQLYYAQHAAYPPTKEAVAALLNPPPSFQCQGNDFRYDPASGQVTLLIEDADSC
jgi:prepilin-type N-terminal cleavage/methylation domain-containing protein